MIYRHKPVLLKESLELLKPKPNGIYVDCTLGLGGHTLGIFETVGHSVRVVGIDWDEEAIDHAIERLKEFGSSLKIVKDSFANLEDILDGLNIKAVDGILLDLGVSSLQLQNEKRGFSFSRDGPLDMRMSKEASDSAEKLINGLGERGLAELFRNFGEERWAKRIARIIALERGRKKRFTRTLELAELIKKIIRSRAKIHPATKVFQALRIAVNDELCNLKKIMSSFDKCLQRNGRIVVISYHSLEDRIVKNAFKEKAGSGIVKILTKKPLRPTQVEVTENPRARSAKLRSAEKII